MRNGSTLKLSLFTVIIFVVVTILVSTQALAGSDEEEDWPYDTNDKQRYMELHLTTEDDHEDRLVPIIRDGNEQDNKRTSVNRVNQYTGSGGDWNEFASWESDPFLKDITANRDVSADYFLEMKIYARSEAPDGSTDLVSIRVTISFGGGEQVQEEDGPRALNNDQHTEFLFDLPFSDVAMGLGQRVTLIVEARTEEEYDPLNEDQYEVVTMTYGCKEYDSFFNFEANTTSVHMEKDANEEVPIQKNKGIAHVNISVVHAFGNEVVRWDRWAYARIHGPANESDPAATNWDNTVCWCDTRMYISWEYDEENGTLHGSWQIMEDLGDPGVRVQYAPDNRTYFLYFKCWDIYHQNNDTPYELNATFRVPGFPPSKKRIELEWAGGVVFYNGNGRRFEANDENGRGIAVGDELYLNASYKLGGGADPERYYNDIPIRVSILTPDGSTEIINRTYLDNGVRGGSYRQFQAVHSWIPDEAGEGYTLRLELNPDRAIPEYNFTNNLLEIELDVHEDRRPTAVITSPEASLEEDPETHLPADEDIHFDGTASLDPDTPYGDLDFEWSITDLVDEIRRDRDEFILQLDPGAYKVTLTVSDGLREDSEEVLIMVEEPVIHSRPTATIISITPESQTEGEEVLFISGGEGDGTIVRYVWASSLDGEFYNGSEVEFTYSKLSVGTHEIGFRVQDENGLWSEGDSAMLEITENVEHGGNGNDGNGGGANGDLVPDDGGGDDELLPTGFGVVLLVLVVVIVLWLRGRTW